MSSSFEAEFSAPLFLCTLILVRGVLYYSRYTYSSHSFGYSFSFSLKVLGVRAIVSGFRVRVRVRVRIRSRGLGDQNYEVGFETIGTVTQNYANFDYSGYFSLYKQHA